MDAIIGLKCEDIVQVSVPLVAFGIGAAIAKTKWWRMQRTKFPEALQPSLRNPIVNGLIFALISVLLLGIVQYFRGTEKGEGKAHTYESLLPPEMYGYGGLMPASGSAMTGGMAKVEFDNTYPHP